MITLESLKALFGDERGEELFEYLTNKNKGGQNNAKGNVFENFFAIYQIAKAHNEGCDKNNTLFSAQNFAFVDDLVVESLAENINRYFQIKDTAALSWTTGTHPIKDDFKVQKQLMTGTGINTEYTMVVAKSEVYQTLVDSIPGDVNFVNVLQYDTETSINSLVRKNAMLKQELVKMCALTNPDLDKLEALGTILLGVWDGAEKKQISLNELMDRSHRLNPNYIKGLNNKISSRLEGIFKNIGGFSYEVQNGYIVWRFEPTDKGELEFAIGSAPYEQWENDVFNSNPTSFEELETFLSA